MEERKNESDTRTELSEEGAVFLIDKPLGWTSFDVVKKIRSSFLPQKVKVGHAGTLDPLATGLVIVCVGNKTKSVNEFMDLDKTYEGTFKLGATTPSFDLETEPENFKDISHISIEEIREKVQNLVGDIKQTPPIYSAVKQGGVRLYKLARKGESVKIREREISVYSFDIGEPVDGKCFFEIKCSKGTYIRTLVHDLGQLLGVGAHLTSLRRTQIGTYSLKESSAIQDFSQ